MTPGLPTPASAIVLAGGRSSRMGRPKALLPFGDTPLIVRVIATLRPRFEEIIVVAAPGQALPQLEATVMRDAVAHQGPVSGMYHGLSSAAFDVCFVTSCDSAFLNPELIAHLVRRIEGHDAVVPIWRERLQPLHAVYRRGVARHLAAQLARRELRLLSVFDRLTACRIEEDEIRRLDPEGASFFNINTPDDYAEALTRDRERRRDPAGNARC